MRKKQEPEPARLRNKRRFVNQKIPKTLIIALLGMVFLLLGVNLLLYLASSSPRQIPYFKELTTMALKLSRPDLVMDRGEMRVQWKGWNQSLRFIGKDWRFMKGQEEVLTIPECAGGFMVGPYLLNHLDVTEAVIRNPSAHLIVGKEEFTGSAALPFEWLLKVMDSHAYMLIHDLSIEDMTLTMEGEASKAVWHIPSIQLQSDEEGFGASVSVAWEDIKELVRAPVEPQAILLAEGRNLKLGETSLSLQFEQFPPALMAGVSPHLHWMGRMKAVASGEVQATITNHGRLRDAEGSISGYIAGGYFSAQGGLKGGTILEDGKDWPDIWLAAAIENFNVNELHRYWPPSVAANAREWITANVKKGTISSITANLHITPQELKGNKLSKEALTAKAEMRDMLVTYHPAAPPLEDAGGEAVINGTSAVITITEGASKNTHLKKGTVAITHLGEAQEFMHIEGTAAGPVPDLLDFFAIAHPGSKPPSLKLGGKAESAFTLEFPLLMELPMERVLFTLDSKLSQVEIKEIAGGVDLTEGVLSVAGDQKTLRLSGVGKLNTLAADLEGELPLSKEREFDGRYRVHFNLPSHQLPLFGIPSLAPELSGTLLVDLGIVNQHKEQKIEAEIGLTEASINMPSIGLVKPLGKSSVLKASMEAPADKQPETARFVLAGDDLKAEGVAALGKNGKELEKIQFTTLKFGRSELTGSIAFPEKNSYVVSLEGSVLDLVPMLDAKAKEEDTAALEMTFNIASVLLKNGQVWKQAEGRVECARTHCVSADMTAGLPSGEEIRLQLVPVDGKRVLNVKADNAGEVLAGFDVSRQIRGGTLELGMELDKVPQGRPAQGMIKMENYLVVKAPVLAKILTLGSLSGIISLLNDQGIAFRKLEGMFTLKDKIVMLEELHAAGPSLGLTAAGTLDLKQSLVSIKGVVVPSYMVNTMLGNVPILGEIITGGEGEGVVAINYKLEGSHKDPVVKVNPLSALAPGFLRKLFSLPDKQ